MKSGQLLVSYRDNGVGFPNNICKGKGLQNTENRIRAMGGNLIFGVEEKPGARLHISIPIN
jgi:signal transduction histidine kinase